MHVDHFKRQQNIFSRHGQPRFFLIKTKTADFLDKSGTNVRMLWVSEIPIDTHCLDYNRRTINLFGPLFADISSLSWHINLEKLFISINCTRCLLEIRSAKLTGSPNYPIKTNFRMRKFFLVE